MRNNRIEGYKVIIIKKYMYRTQKNKKLWITNKRMINKIWMVGIMKKKSRMNNSTVKEIVKIRKYR